METEISRVVYLVAKNDHVNVRCFQLDTNNLHLGNMYYWAIHEKKGPAHIAEAAVAIDHKIYSFGTSVSRSGNGSIDVCVFNTLNYRWSYLRERKFKQDPNVCAPCQLDGYSSVTHNGKIYIWGGLIDGVACDVLFCFEPNTLQWSRPEVFGAVPSSRIRHSACVIDHTMYVYGGLDAHSANISVEVNALDFRSMEWRHIYTRGLPPCVEFPVASVVGSKMYIYSECEDSDFMGHECPGLMYLDTTTYTWHSPRISGRLPKDIYDYLMFVRGQYVFMFIGRNGFQGICFQYLYRLDTQTHEWDKIKTIGYVPQVKHATSLVVIGDNVFFFGGIKNIEFPSSFAGKFTHLDDLHVLHFAPTLRILASQVVLHHRLDTSDLPQVLKWELINSNFIQPNPSVL